MKTNTPPETRLWALVLLAFSLCLALQWGSGCHNAELSGYLDEPGHYITGLMVNGYASGGWMERSPMRFAERFYLHYPKVALGHWPPVYYMVQAIWEVFFGRSISALLYLQAVFIAGIAALLFVYGRRQYGAPIASLVALLFVALPLSQELSWQVMAEPLLALLTLVATLAIAEYFVKGDSRWLVVYAIATEAAIHTKLSGIVLVLGPLAVAVFLGRWDVLRKRAFWLAQTLVVAFAIPWQVWTRTMTVNGLEGPVSVRLIVDQIAGFGVLFPQLFGMPLALLVVCGAVLALWPFKERDPLVVACALIGVGTLVFHSISPSGVEGRRIYMAIPGMLLLTGLAAKRVSNLLPAWRWSGTALIVACGGLGLLLAAPPMHKTMVGYRQLAQWLVDEQGNQEQAVLIGSAIDGEGLLVAEVGQLQPKPLMFLVRASKLLADVDWSGRDYRLLIRDVDTLQKLLDSIPIRYLVLDRFSLEQERPHTELLWKLVDNRPDLWLPRKHLPASSPQNGARGEITVFERADLRNAKVVSLQISLQRMLGRVVAK